MAVKCKCQMSNASALWSKTETSKLWKLHSIYELGNTDTRPRKTDTWQLAILAQEDHLQYWHMTTSNTDTHKKTTCNSDTWQPAILTWHMKTCNNDMATCKADTW